MRAEVIDSREDIELLSFRARSAHRAIEACEAAIIQKDVFTSSEAQTLGVATAAYYVEAYVHHEDMLHVPGIVRGQRITDPRTTKNIHSDRIRLEVVIHKAQQGEYRDLKATLYLRAQYLKGPDIYSERLRKVGEGLEILVGFMDDHGNRAQLPFIPAWMDERFNNDAADFA